MVAEEILVLNHKEASELITKLYNTLNRRAICPRCKRKKDYVKVDFANGGIMGVKNICRVCRR